MDIRKAMKVRDSANSAVKLTKAGEKYSKASEKELEKFFNKITASKVNLNELLGVSVNPLLNSEQIRDVFKLLKEHSSLEKNDKNVKPATRTRNMGIRGKIKKQLSLHQNLDKDAIKALLKSRTMGVPAVLDNPNTDKEDLNTFFENNVMPTGKQTEYNFVKFKELMETDNVTSSIALDWYYRLKEYADWEYKDNQWYAVIDAFLEFDDCPFEILYDIMNLSTVDNRGEFYLSPLKYRRAVLAHKNATDELKELAYEKTGREEFLPDEIKELFLF